MSNREFLFNLLIKGFLDSDIGNVSTSEQRAAVAREIRDACINVGFFYSECLCVPMLLFLNFISPWARHTSRDHQ